jgi:hypothetical protein
MFIKQQYMNLLADEENLEAEFHLAHWLSAVPASSDNSTRLLKVDEGNSSYEDGVRLLHNFYLNRNDSMPNENDDDNDDEEYVIVDVNYNPTTFEKGQRLRERLVNHLSPQLLKKK